VDYVARFPRDFTGSAEVATAPLLAAVRRMVLVAARHTPVTLTFCASEPRSLDRGLRSAPSAGDRFTDRLVLEAATGEEAQAVEELPARLSGPGVTVRFNPYFLLDGVSGVDTDAVLMRFTDSGPVLLSGKSTDYQYLLMPIRLPAG
jgi:DNA polymerase-3 subunit beta